MITRILLFSASWLTACSVHDAGVYNAGPAALSEDGLRAGDDIPHEDQVVLAFVNDPLTDVEMLDIDVGLDARAAVRIVAHRDGSDGEPGTRDDDPFDSIAEVDAIPWMTEDGIADLRAWVLYEAGHEPGLGGIVEGVSFTEDEALATLALVNAASFIELDEQVDIDARAARGIIEQRPFVILDELAVVEQVGPATLQALRDYANPL